MEKSPTANERARMLAASLESTAMGKISIAVIRLLGRYPGVVALIGFVSGLASLFLVERNTGLAKVMTVLMVFAWLWLVLERHVRRLVLRRFRLRVPRPALRFVNQMVHQESLFFVLPFIVYSTTWETGQLFFALLVSAAALASLVDPLYYRWLAPKQWLYHMYHGFTVFVLLLVSLPIIFQLPTSRTYWWALGAAVLASAVGAVRNPPTIWKSRFTAVLGTVVLAGFMGWGARPWVPTASLWVTDGAITSRVSTEQLSAANDLRVVSPAQLEQGLYAFTAIRAPLGLHEQIDHVWHLDGHEIDRIPLEIEGGRAEGYRAWSHKVNFPQLPHGQWDVEVQTGSRQVVGVLRFQVRAGVEPSAPSPAEGP